MRKSKQKKHKQGIEKRKIKIALLIALLVMIIPLFVSAEIQDITGMAILGSELTTHTDATISECTNLSTTSTTYTLDQNVSSTNTCFNISAYNTVLDCAGYTITYADGGSAGAPEYGVYSNGYDNATIKNCIIRTLNGNNDDDKYGIYFTGVENSTILNNTISTNGTDSNFGIYLFDGSNFNIIQNNTISTDGTDDKNHGVYIVTSSSNNVSSNIISTDGTSDDNYGLYLISSSSNTIQNNSISTHGTDSNYGLSIISSSNSNIIQNNIISTNGTTMNHGIKFNSGSSNIIQNNTISTDGSSSNHGLYFYSSFESNNISYNTFSTIGTSSHAFFLEVLSSNYPENNSLTSNTLSNVEGDDLNFDDAGINGTFLIDQTIRSYTFTGVGGTLNIKNSSTGLITFTAEINESGTNLFGNSTSDIQISNNSIFVNKTSNPGLNSSANITVYGIDVSTLTDHTIQRDGSECNATTTPACSNFTTLNTTTVSFNTSSWSKYNISGEPPAALIDCSNLTESTTMNQNVSSANTCFNISANNIALDCAGYTITYAEGGSAGSPEYGVYNNNYNNATIKNCIIRTIYGNNDDDKYAIYLLNADNSTITNNTISTNGTDHNYGIFLSSSDSNNVSNNYIVANGSTTTNYGIYSDGKGNIIEHNIIFTDGTSDNIGIRTSGSYQILKHNNISTSGSSSDNYGLSPASNYDLISDNNISAKGTSYSVGIWLSGDSNNLTSNIIVTNGTTGANNYGIKFNSGADRNIINYTRITTSGATNNNYGVHCYASSSNQIINSNISTSGSTGSSHGIYFVQNSENNTAKNNVISTTSANSHAFKLDSSGGSVPHNNNLTNNTLNNIAGDDINFADAGINNTFLIDQPISNYSFTGIGGTLSIKNTSTGLITFTDEINGSGGNLFGNSTSDIQISNNSIFVNVTAKQTLNSSANITVYGIDVSTLANLTIQRDGVECNATTTPSCYNFTTLNTTTVQFNVSSWSKYNISGVPPPPLIDCSTLTESTTMNQDVNSSGTCFTIGAADITLDCAGYTINYSTSATGIGIDNNNGFDNVNIQNCNIVQGGSSSGSNYGIYFVGVTDSTITNTSIITNGTTTNRGIFFQSNSNNNNISNTSIVTNGSSGNVGIYLDTSNNNIFRNLSIETHGPSGGDSYGVLFDRGSRNLLVNSTISTNGSTSNYGIYFNSDASENVVANNSISTDGSSSDAFIFNAQSTKYPKNNTISNNILGTINGEDLNIIDAGINDTQLIDQPIRDYTFTGVGGTLRIKNSSTGEITFISNISGSGGNLFGNSTSDIRIENNSIIVNITSNGGLNSSANITVYGIDVSTLTDHTIQRDGAECNATTTPACSNFTTLNTTTVQFNASSWSKYNISGIPPVTLIDCGNLTESTTMNQNVSSTNTCFNISADNITLDCAGYTITYAEGGSAGSPEYGVYSNGYDNVTIKNCIIRTLNGNNDDDKYGVYFNSVNNSIIINNTISTNGTDNNYGIYLTGGSSNNQLKNNIVYTNGTTGSNYGIDIEGSHSNIIANNTISASGDTSQNFGIYLEETSNSNQVLDNNVSTAGTTQNFGVYLVGVSYYNNTIQNNNISTSGSSLQNHGIYLRAGYENLLSGNTISTSGTTQNHGILLFRNVENSTAINNTISTSGTSSDGINLDANGGLFPNYNNLSSNRFIDITNLDLNLSDAGINGTLLIDQPISNYSFTGVGGTLSIKNSSTGEITFISNISGSGSNLFGNSTSDIRIDNNSIIVNITSNIGLNASANITVYGIDVSGLTNLNILHDGVSCSSSTTPSCYNFTSLAAASVKFNVSSWSKYNISGTPLIDCSTLTTSTTMDQNVTSTGTCFTIGAANIVLDCAGYTITYKTGGAASKYGIDNSAGHDNVNITNCNIVAGNASGSDGHGIYFSGVTNSLINNNNITANGSSSNNGIYFSSSSNNNISSNILTTKGSGNNNEGIYISSSSNNTLSNNNITTNGSSNNNGIYLLSSSNSNNITSNTIITNGVGNNYGIRISSCYTNNILSNILNPGGSSSTNAGIFIDSSSTNTLISNNISTSGTATDYGFFISSDSDNNTITNNTINTSGSTTSHAFFLSLSGSSIPENNNITSNTLRTIAGDDLKFNNAGINNTYLTDQPIKDYTFTGVGNTLSIKNSSTGEIIFTSNISGTGSNLFGNSTSDIRIDNNSIIVTVSNNGGLNASANITIYGTPGTGLSSLMIQQNGSECNSTTTPACSNFTSLTAASVKFNVSSWSKYNISGDVSATLSFSTILNQTVRTNNPLGYDIQATDEASVDCFSVNNTDNFTINCSGYLENNSVLSIGTYYLNITINDTSGNENYTIMYVEAIAPLGPSSDSINTDEWRTFGRNLNHTHYTKSFAPPNISDTTQIINTLGDPRFVYPPGVIANNTIFFGTVGGFLYALNSTNVSREINMRDFTQEAGYSTASATDYSSVAGDSLYVYIYHDSADAVLYHLNLSDINQTISKNEDLVSNDAYKEGPVVYNGFVYMTDHYDNRILQYNASDVTQTIYSLDISSSSCDSIPAIADEYLYIGCDDNQMHQLNASNVSKLIATYTTGDDVDSMPAVANGYVYFGSDDGKVYQVNASNISQLIATYTTGGDVNGHPGVAHGFVYIGSDDDVFYQLNASNISIQIANYTGSNNFRGGPAINDLYVFMMNGDTQVYQFNAKDVSKKIGSVDVGSANSNRGPLLAGGYVYAPGGTSYKITQLGTPLPTSVLNDPQHEFEFGYAKQNVTFNCSVHDMTNSANITFYITNSTNQSFSVNQTINVTGMVNESNWTLELEIGNYTWNCLVYDNDSNSDWATNRTMGLDTTPPSITYTTPINGSFSLDSTIDVNYTIVEANLDSCWYSNDTLGVNTTLNNCINITNVSWSEARHNVTVWANDTTGNVGSSNITFTLDLSLPALTNISNQTTEYDNNFSYDINATDSVGVDCFTVNDTDNFQINCSGYLENNTRLNIEIYYLNITVNDSTGNSNSSIMWVNVTDTIAPSFTNITNKTIFDTDSLTYDINETEDNDTDCYTVNDTTNFQINCSGYLENNTVLSVGLYLLNITVNDTTGNENVSKMWVNVTKKPFITLELDYPTTDLNATPNVFFNVTVNITCTRADCGQVNISVFTAYENSSDVEIAFSCYNSGCSDADDLTDYLIDEGFPLTQKRYTSWNDAQMNDSAFDVIVVGGSYLGGYYPFDSSADAARDAFEDEAMPTVVALDKGYTPDRLGITTTTCTLDSSDNHIIDIGTHNIMTGIPANTSVDTTSDDICYFTTAQMTDPYTKLFAPQDAGAEDIAGFAMDAGQATTGTNPGKFVYLGFDTQDTYPSATGNDSLIIKQATCWAATGSYDCTPVKLTNATEGATPFYTNTTHPYNVTLSENDSVAVTIWINASGTGTGEFFVYANKTSDQSISNSTGKWNTTILIDTTNPTFTVFANQTAEFGNNFTYDINATDANDVDCFTVNDTDNFQINCSGYLENNSALNTGMYWLNISVNDTNSNNISDIMWVNVSDNNTPIFTNISNQTVEYGSSLAHDINATDPSNISCFSVNHTTNFSINCSGYLENSTNISIGLYWLNITVNDTLNNTNTTTIWVNISDTTAPSFVNISNQTAEFGNNFTYDINATDLSNVDCFIVNDTTNFEINCSGYLQNKTALSVFQHWLNISVNDTYANNDSALIWVNISDTTGPTFTAVYNQTVRNQTALAHDINATDLSNVSCFTVNHSTNFTINCSGYLENKTVLNIRMYWLNITANDTRGNNDSTLMWVNATDTIKPNVTINYPIGYSAYTDLTSFNYTVNETNLDTCWYSTDDGVTNLTEGDTGTSFVNISIDPGTYNVTIYCNDTGGNLGNDTLRFILGDYNTNLQITKIMASDPGLNEQFGYSVDYAGEEVIIGARWDNDSAPTAGAAYIFRKNAAGQYVEVNKLTASDAQDSDRFGYSVGISGDYAIVGAWIEDEKALSAGAAYIFKKNSTGQFEEVNKLMASDGGVGDNFGVSVDIDGDYAVIGAYADDDKGTNAGAAYIFKRNATGQYAELHKITASDGQEGDTFGNAVAIEGDYAVIGAENEDDSTVDNCQEGAVYVYKKNSTGQFAQHNKLRTSDADAHCDQMTGDSVAISGDYIAASGDCTSIEASEGTYVFKKDSQGNFTQIQKLNTTKNVNYDPDSVAISGDYLIVGVDSSGAGGQVYIFKRNSTDEFAPLDTISGSDAQSGDAFGSAVAISGEYLVGGATGEDEGETGAGAAYVFRILSDTDPPTLNLTNQTGETKVAFSYDINATDISNISCYTVNNTDNFSINCSGYLTNNSILNVGLYWLNISVNDTVPNNTSGIMFVNVTNSIPDTDKPNITLFVPVNNTLNKTSNYILFQYNVTDNQSGIQNCSIYFNGTINTTNTSITEGSIINITLYLNNGAYNWSVNCTDDSNNSNIGGSEVRNLTVNRTIHDTDKPNVTLFAPSNNTLNTTSHFVLFQYNVTDNQSGIANCSLMFNGTINTTNTTITEASIINITLYMNNGVYNWSVNCTDESNDTNIGGSEVRNLTVNITTIDTVKPNLTLWAPANSTLNTTSHFILFQYNVTDNTSAIANCSLILNNTINTTNTSITESSIINITLFLNDGSYNWSLNCTDDSNNTNTVASETRNLTVNITRIDTQKPNITLFAPANNTLNSSTNYILFQYNVTDNISAIANCSLIFNGTINTTNTSISEASIINITLWINNGAYNWSVNCTDDSNNTNIGASEIRNLTVNRTIQDTDKPNITLFAPANNTLNTTSNNILFQYNVTDNTSQITNCSLIFNGTINKTNVSITQGSIINITLRLDNGTYNWSVNCTDTSSNKNVGGSEIRNLTIDVITIDTVKPNITLWAPINNTLNTTSHDIVFLYNVTDNSSNIANCSLIFNGTINTTDSTISESTIINFTLLLNDGSYNWSINCTDDSNNSNREASEIRNLTVNITTIDTIAPYITLFAPANNTLNETSHYIKFQYNVTDNISAIANCSLYFNGTVNITNTTVSEASIINITLYLDNGAYNWSINCTDDSNNTNIGASEMRNLTVNVTIPDTDKPNITLWRPADTGFNTTSHNITFQFNVTDNLSDIVNCTLIINSTINTTITSITEASKTNISLIFNNGGYNWTINCTDNSANNNTGTSETRTFRVTAAKLLHRPRHSNTRQYIINGSITKKWHRGIGFNRTELIKLTHPTYGLRFEAEGNFSASDVDLINLTLEQDDHRTVANKTNTSGIATNYTLYVPSTKMLGLYICPQAKAMSELDPDCSNRITFTHTEAQTGTWKQGIFAGLYEDKYHILNLTGSGAGSDVSECGELNLSNTTYTVIQNISSDNTCLNITEDNITLDCKGYTINYSKSSQGYGIYITAANATVKNCNIRQADSSTSSNHGIYLQASTDSIIQNTTIITGGTNDNYGIYTLNSSSNTIINTSITTTGSSTNNFGVIINDSSNTNMIYDSTITTNGTGYSAGVYIINSSKNNITNCTISTNGTQHSYAIWLSANSANNTIKNNMISTDSTNLTSDAFFINASTTHYPDDNQIINNTLTSIDGLDLYIYSTGINNTQLTDQLIGNYTINGAGSTIIIKNSTLGQIKFITSINGSGKNLFGNSSSDIRIENNTVTVNITNNIGLNSSANITVYGINTSLLVPAILRNNLVCNSTTQPSCYNFTSLRAGDVIFNLSHWSNYSIGENPDFMNDTDKPNITIWAPVNNTINLTSNSILFQFNVTDNLSEIANCSLIFNNSINITNTSITEASIINISRYMNNGAYNWSINCTDNSTNTNTQTSGTYSLTVTFTTSTTTTISGSSGGSSGGGGGSSARPHKFPEENKTEEIVEQPPAITGAAAEEIRPEKKPPEQKQTKQEKPVKTEIQAEEKDLAGQAFSIKDSEIPQYNKALEWIIGIIFLLACVGIIGYGIWHGHTNKEQPEEKTVLDIDITTSFQQTIKEAHSKISAGDIETATELYKKALDQYSNIPQDKQAQMYPLLTGLYNTLLNLNKNNLT